jgi:hypothetical protein
MFDAAKALWADTPFDIDQHLILAGYRGSVSHGTFVPSTDPHSTDDIDLLGIVVPPIDYLLGVRDWEHAEAIKGEWDTVVYSYQKFISLLCNQNPNVLCLLYLKPEHYTKWTLPGELLVRNRKLFLAKEQAYKTFKGYAHAQIDKLLAKSDRGYMGLKRKLLREKYGYDPKMASHAIRLLAMGIEFLRDGELNVCRTSDAQFFINIKQGKFDLTYITDLADAMFLQLDDAYASSPLPSEIDYTKVNALAVEVATTFHTF